MSIEAATFAAIVTQTVVEGRQLAESLMTDTFAVKYKTGATTQDEATGAEVPVYATEFTSPCKFQSNTLSTDEVESGGRRVVVDQLQIHYPVGKPQVRQDAVIVCTAVGPKSDPRLVGRDFVVGAPMNKTYATATRLNVKDKP